MTFRQRLCLVDRTQEEALWQRIAKHGGTFQYMHPKRILYDTPDRLIARRVLADSPFVQTFCVEHEGESLDDGNACVRLTLLRKTGELWTRRTVEISLRGLELFLRAGIFPPQSCAIDMQLLAQIKLIRMHLPLRAVSFVSGQRVLWQAPDGLPLRIFTERDMRMRQMALSLEAGDYGEPIWPRNGTLLGIETRVGIPDWLMDVLAAENIDCSWPVSMDLMRRMAGCAEEEECRVDRVSI